MKPHRKYTSALSMRTALEERLNRRARDKGQDIMRLRRHVAFDRFLSRLFAGQTDTLIMKGGYVLELWLDHARATKDIDISMKAALKSGLGEKKASNPKALQDFLQQLASVNLGDYFEFMIGKAVLDLENAPYGGYRFPVEARMAGRVFIRFDIDVAAGDVWIEPHEVIPLQDWFGFAGIEAQTISVISREQQFAEKLHAYTLQRKTPNSRIKDMVDLFLLIRLGSMDSDKVKSAVMKTFARRQTHPFPPVFHEPPAIWATPFRKLIVQCGLDAGIDLAAKEVKTYCQNHGLVT